jgi:hypothetical protein
MHEFLDTNAKLNVVRNLINLVFLNLPHEGMTNKFKTPSRGLFGLF